jgi:hypothetical protein
MRRRKRCRRGRREGRMEVIILSVPYRFLASETVPTDGREYPEQPVSFLPLFVKLFKFLIALIFALGILTFGIADETN